MIEGKASTLLNTLKLDKVYGCNKFVCIEELNNSDASFIISTIIKDQIEKENNVVLIMCHNSIGHFHSISQKFGYNLMSLKDSNRVLIVDILDKIANNDFILLEESLKQLYLDVRNKISSWSNETGVCFILENIGNLLLANVSNVLNFVQYVRGLVHERKNSMCVSTVHNFLGCPNFNKFTVALKHVADCVVIIKELATGRANEVTGHITVRTRDEKFVASNAQYHYLLQDKSVFVFNPGSNEHLYKR